MSGGESAPVAADTAAGDGGGAIAADVATEIAAWEGRVGDRASEYWHGPHAEQNQQRLLDLYRARDGGTPPAAPSPRDKEIAAIETLMHNDRPAYNASPETQRRYLALLRARHGDAASNDAPAPAVRAHSADEARAALAEARAALPDDLRAQWDEGGPDAFVARAQRVHEATAHALAGVGDAAAAEAMQQGFAALPLPIRTAVWAELGRGAPTFPAPASEDYAAVIRRGFGADFADALGPRKLAVLRERWTRLQDAMTDRTAPGSSAWPTFTAWFDALTPPQHRAILWALAHG